MGSIIRNAVIVFVLGWFAWFWLDNGAPYHPVAMPPGTGDDLVRNLQFGVRLVKVGQWEAAFTHLWRTHYLLASLAGGALLSFAWPFLRRTAGQLYRRRRRPASNAAHVSRVDPEP